GRGVQRALDVGVPVGDGRGDGTSGPDVGLDACGDRPQRRADRAGEQRATDRRDRVVYRAVRTRFGEPEGARPGRLADDAAGPGAGGSGTGPPPWAFRRGGGRGPAAAPRPPAPGAARAGRRGAAGGQGGAPFQRGGVMTGDGGGGAPVRVWDLPLAPW